jgi:hypothetical protein
MKIHTEEQAWSVYEGTTWTAIDTDTYDGAPDSNSPVGWGHTERDAINDLVGQFIEELEEKIDDLRWENRCLRAELKAFGSTKGQIAGEACSPQPRGDLQIGKEGQDSGPESGGQESAPSEMPPRFMGRSPDDLPYSRELLDQG